MSTLTIMTRIIWTMILKRMSLTLKAGKENFCNEPDANLQWESLILEYPDDMQIHTLHALRIGLCFKVNRGDLTDGQTTEIFENMKRALINAEAI
ncbi:MAG: hypothetical protein HN862_07685 [Candidatus Scalindua sp.]|mgnify:CR=1|nr:hypothetical protein [Candidatus Scalindua sp.]MBT7592200.1 hypothetical protein [Candidatus Scalindua sp.]